MTIDEIKEIFKDDIAGGYSRIFLYLRDGGGKRVEGIYLDELDDYAEMLSHYVYAGKSISGLHEFHFEE